VRRRAFDAAADPPRRLAPPLNRRAHARSIRTRRGRVTSARGEAAAGRRIWGGRRALRRRRGRRAGPVGRGRRAGLVGRGRGVRRGG
jgi:hypothetical protein